MQVEEVSGGKGINERDDLQGNEAKFGELLVFNSWDDLQGYTK